MALDHNCLAFIKVPIDEDQTRHGAGYLVKSDLLITARHVIYGKEAQPSKPKEIIVKFLADDAEIYQAEAIWQNTQADICLLKLTRSKSYSNFAQWGRFDRTINNGSLTCEGCGFPKAGKQENKFSSQGLAGLLDRHAYVGSGLLGIALSHGFSPASAELCQGFSGSPIFVGDYLIGVVVIAPNGYEGERIAAYPIEKLIADADFCKLTTYSDTELHLINNSQLSGQEDAQERLAKMPLHEIPHPTTLPKFSRMRLPVNANFVGREDEFRAIAKALKAGKTTSIGQTTAATGMGGVGKTQLACEFVHRYGQYFAGGVFWLNFGEPASIDTAIAECGGHHLHDNYDKLSLPEQLKLVKSAWAEPIPRLLVFDNCEDPKLLTKYRPSTGNNYILITSRRGEWPKSLAVNALALDILDRESSIKLLLQHRPDLVSEREVLNDIAAELGDLPLALHLAGNFLEVCHHEESYEEYLGNPKAYLEAVRKDKLDHSSLTEKVEGYSPTEHDLNVASTFRYSYKQLEKTNEIDIIAIRLLKCAAFFSYGTPIPRNLLKACLRIESNDDKTALKLVNGLKRLIHLGLIIEDQKGDLTLHRLIGNFIHKVDTDKQAQTDVEETILKESRRLKNQTYTAPIISLQPHLKAITDNAISRENSLTESLCESLGYHLQYIGYFKSALHYYKQALEISEKVSGKEHPDTAINLNNLGFLFTSMGEYQQALPYYKRALEISEKVLGAEHPDTAINLGNIGISFYSMGEYQQALPYYKRALEISEKVLGAEHPDTAKSLNNLGALFTSIGEYQQAFPYYKRALEISAKVLGAEHPDTARSLNNLGFLLKSMGEYQQAFPYYKLALEIYEQVLGKEHPDTAMSLNNLGSLLSSIGEYQQAFHCYKLALEIREKVLGKEHPDTAYSLNSLGTLFNSMGEYQQAFPYFQRALEIKEKALGKEHPDTAISLNNLGGLFNSIGKYQQAFPYFQRALEIYEKVLGKEHPNIATILDNLGVSFYSMGEYQQAFPYFQRALEIKEKALGKEHPDTAYSLNNLGFLFDSMKEYQQAFLYYLRALDIFKARLGDNHPNTQAVQRNLDILTAIISGQKRGNASE